jgi:hypothetical protein
MLEVMVLVHRVAGVETSANLVHPVVSLCAVIKNDVKAVVHKPYTHLPLTVHQCFSYSVWPLNSQNFFGGWLILRLYVIYV